MIFFCELYTFLCFCIILASLSFFFINLQEWSKLRTSNTIYKNSFISSVFLSNFLSLLFLHEDRLEYLLLFQPFCLFSRSSSFILQLFHVFGTHSLPFVMEEEIQFQVFLVGAFSLKEKSPTLTVSSFFFFFLFFSVDNLTLSGPLFLQFCNSAQKANFTPTLSVFTFSRKHTQPDVPKGSPLWIFFGILRLKKYFFFEKKFQK